MVNLARFARMAPCTKPIGAFATLAIMIAFIMTTVVVTSGKKTSSKDMYLVSFNYDLSNATNTNSKRDVTDSPAPASTSTYTVFMSSTAAPSPTQSGSTLVTSASSTASATPTSNNVTPDMHNQFRDAVQTLINEDETNSNITFQEVRVGYSGICVEVASDAGIKGDTWICGTVNATESLGATTGGDPFDLIGIALYFKDKIAFALPWWISVVCLGLAFLCQFVNSIPFFPIPPIVQRVGCGLSILGTGCLLAGLVLAHVSSNTVATLAGQLTLNTINAHVGSMNQALGWASFALSFLASMGISLLVAADLALRRAERMADRTIDTAVNKGLDRMHLGGSERSFSGSSKASSAGLGRTMGPTKPEMSFADLKGISKARTRGEALTALTGIYRPSEKDHANMV